MHGFGHFSRFALTIVGCVHSLRAPLKRVDSNRYPGKQVLKPLVLMV